MGYPQSMNPFNNIDPQRKSIITQAVLIVFGIQAIRDGQVQAIHHVLYNEDPVTIINRRPADDKSLVPLTVGANRRNIGLLLFTVRDYTLRVRLKMKHGIYNILR